ncbi:hypothetical protein [Halolactibacillus miurensis]|uniref:hypothetical protein n=1 Tax=Halolactibacillus miurensis TaxID=306541 RepID=UPI0015A68105|nr:hypothetical protein [Halolactibacillus miurensis]
MCIFFMVESSDYLFFVFLPTKIHDSLISVIKTKVPIAIGHGLMLLSISTNSDVTKAAKKAVRE